MEILKKPWAYILSEHRIESNKNPGHMFCLSIEKDLEKKPGHMFCLSIEMEFEKILGICFV